MAKMSLVYGVSFAVHGALAVGVLGLREPTRRETVAISVSEAKKKAPEPAKVLEDPSPAPPRTEPRPARSRAAPAPKPDAPPPEAAARARSPVLDALPDLGIDMGNVGPGGNGLAIPAGPQGPAPAATAAEARPPPPKVLAPKPVDECSEPLVKPKPRSISQPAYTAAAREANVEGRVRVEVSVGADGKVTGVRLLSGLGFGLDEAALEAARRAGFDPGTRCGKPVAATFVIAMRFSL
jgi:periplasmic protein TonB